MFRGVASFSCSLSFTPLGLGCGRCASRMPPGGTPGDLPPLALRQIPRHRENRRSRVCGRVVLGCCFFPFREKHPDPRHTRPSGPHLTKTPLSLRRKLWKGERSFREVVQWWCGAGQGVGCEWGL